MPLPEQRRQQLDGIVKQMIQNNEPDDNIQFVVNDFTTKYQNEAQDQGQGPQLKDTGSFIGNVANSAVNFGKGIGELLFNPAKVGKGVLGLGAGLVEKAIPAGPQGAEKNVDAVVDFYKQRYGSVENFLKTAYQDPVGTAADVSILFGGAGAAAKGVAGATRSTTLANVGSKLSTVGRALDPLAQATRGVGKVAQVATQGRRIAPFASKFDNETAALAREADIDLPTSGLSNSKVVHSMEAITGRGFFGGKISEKVEAAGQALNRYADDTIKAAGGSADALTAGTTIRDSLLQFKDDFIKVKDSLYDDVTTRTQTATAPIRPADFSKTVKFLDDVVTQKQRASRAMGQTAPDFERFQNFKDSLSNPGNTLQDMIAASKEIKANVKTSTDPFVTGNKAVLQKLAATLDSELDDVVKSVDPEFGEAIKKANTFYKEGLTKLNSAYGKKIYSLKDRPDLIAEKLIGPNTSVVDIPELLKILGPKATQELRTYVLKDMFTKARSATNGNFTAAGLTQQIRKMGDDTLQALLTPEQFQAVKNIEKLAKSYNVGQKIAEGSQTAFIARLAGEVSLLFTSPLLGLKILLGDALVSKIVSSKTGQQLLTSGFTLKGTAGKKLQQIAPKLRAGTKASVVSQPLRTQPGQEQSDKLPTNIKSTYPNTKTN